MVLSILLLVAIFYENEMSDMSVSAVSSAKKLPIYCVETKDKKVALSFDAARGDARDGLFCFGS